VITTVEYDEMPGWSTITNRFFTLRTLLQLLIPFIVLGQVTEAKQITVVFRYDDVCNASSTDVEMRILAAFEKRGVPITFAVIPFGGPFPKEAGQPDPSPLNETKAWMLHKALNSGSIEIAQHGYSHEDVRAGQAGGSSEFSEQPYDKQLDRIARGKRHLEYMLDRRVMSFVPPWNTYDGQTIRAAKALRFQVFSPGGPDTAMQAKYNILCLGCCQSPATLKQRVDEARKSAGRHPVVTALFHSYQIRDYNKDLGEFTFAELESILDWINDQHDLRCMTLSRAATTAYNQNTRPVCWGRKGTKQH
jgi:peptidoglycan/xylan/chitin deacetylase (PgdA/CDA1 family)